MSFTNILGIRIANHLRFRHYSFFSLLILLTSSAISFKGISLSGLRSANTEGFKGVSLYKTIVSPFDQTANSVVEGKNFRTSHGGVTELSFFIVAISIYRSSHI